MRKWWNAHTRQRVKKKRSMFMSWMKEKRKILGKLPSYFILSFFSGTMRLCVPRYSCQHITLWRWKNKKERTEAGFTPGLRGRNCVSIIPGTLIFIHSHSPFVLGRVSLPGHKMRMILNFFYALYGIFLLLNWNEVNVHKCERRKCYMLSIFTLLVHLFRTSCSLFRLLLVKVKRDVMWGKYTYKGTHVNRNEDQTAAALLGRVFLLVGSGNRWFKMPIISFTVN